ncbi:MAG: putative Se/S carrier-like protein [Christensenellaceae bacterium]
MYIIFYKTNNVFRVEEILNANHISCDIVPTPVQDKAYCGICIKVISVELNSIKPLISSLDFKIIEE